MGKIKNVVDLELYSVAKYLLENYPNSLIKQDLFSPFALLKDDGSYVENFEGYSVEDANYLNECMADECNAVFSGRILGICGCGSPEDTYLVLRDVLQIQFDYIQGLSTYAERERKYDALGVCGLVGFVLYILDAKSILSHGSSISGASLTDLGKKYLYVLNRLKFDGGILDGKVS